MIGTAGHHAGLALLLLFASASVHGSDGVTPTASDATAPGTAAATATPATDTAASPHPPNTPEAMFERLDRNGDGAIDAEEFRNAMSRRFSLLDADGDGRLAGDEIPPNGRLAKFADADGHLTLEQFQDAIPYVMTSIDSDGNGTLSLDELRNARQTTASQEKTP